MNWLRRLASLPGLRRVLLHRAVRRRLAGALALRFLLAATVVTTPWSLLRAELTRRGSVRTYRLRKSGLPVAMQHGRDLEALHEIFVHGEYEPPAALAARLAPEHVGAVLDVGANVGMFAAWACGRWPRASLTCIEPDAANTSVLRTWVHESGGQVRVLEAAASTSAGTMTFLDGMGSGSRLVTAQEEVDHRTGTTVETVDVLPMLAAADLAKIDIEGGEWPILADPRLAAVTALVLVIEYHRVGAPSLPARDAAQGLLEAAGFHIAKVTPNHWGHGTMWAWKG